MQLTAWGWESTGLCAALTTWWMPKKQLMMPSTMATRPLYLCHASHARRRGVLAEGGSGLHDEIQQANSGAEQETNTHNTRHPHM